MLVPRGPAWATILFSAARSTPLARWRSPAAIIRPVTSSGRRAPVSNPSGTSQPSPVAQARAAARRSVATSSAGSCTDPAVRGPNGASGQASTGATWRSAANSSQNQSARMSHHGSEETT